MPQLLVRNVPEETIRALKRRAAENGRSMEAEVRSVLESAVAPTLDFWAEADRLRNELAEEGVLFDSVPILREIRNDD